MNSAEIKFMLLDHEIRVTYNKLQYKKMILQGLKKITVHHKLRKDKKIVKLSLVMCSHVHMHRCCHGCNKNVFEGVYMW